MNIFVGNLAFTTTEQDLRQPFEPYGTVDTVRIMTDRETGRSRGFGFVEMPDHGAAQTAIDALNGHPSQCANRAIFAWPEFSPLRRGYRFCRPFVACVPS